MKVTKKKIKLTVEELLAEYERLCESEARLTKALTKSQETVAALSSRLSDTSARLRKYESMAGIEYAFAGQQEVNAQLRMARDASLALVEAALKGADPERVTEAARRLAATGSAVGIEVPKALPRGRAR